MPEQPLATASNPAAPFPPVDSQPVFVPPSVTDPVSNLDFLPVDDAFALEMRSESIEQLVGGDALRRGESERIEAGRSQANADLVAGRDRVRVHATLHEHAGHALAEQAAHLHTTVDGTLDVHAASEDTVLLAGHMRELWDRGAAIVAAMADDTVGGGGIRVTTPLDLWVHGLMGMEERIGTCTADAVLLELGATHYEREYGPGAHAAGLAVYAGSLYQSNRSTFRPLMRVSSGVRNLIPGRGGGGGGGDAGAGDAPAASTPPACAAGDAGDAGTQAASKTLCAATGAGGTVQAGAMAGVRSENLTGIHPGDEVAALTLGANVPGACDDLTELRRGEDAAGQLEALRDAMRGGEAGTQGEMTSVSRIPNLGDDASVHEASALDIEAVVRPEATVPGMDPPVLHATVSPPQPPSGVKLGLLGGADRPPQPAAPESDFHAIHHRLSELRSQYVMDSRMDIALDFRLAEGRIHKRVMTQFKNFCKNMVVPRKSSGGFTMADQAYSILGKAADQAEEDGNFLRAKWIRAALDAIDEFLFENLRALCEKYEISAAPFNRPIPRLTTTIGPTVTVASIPPPGHAINQSNWIPVYRHLVSLEHHFERMGWQPALGDFYLAVDHMTQSVMRRFRKLDGNPAHLLPLPQGVTMAEQKYRALVDMLGQAEESDAATQGPGIRHALKELHDLATMEWVTLTTKYGALDGMSNTMQQPPMPLTSATGVPTMSGALPVTIGPPVSIPPMTAPPPGRLNIPFPEYPITVVEDLALLEPAAGSLVHTTGVPGPPLASGLPGPSLADATAEAGDLGPWTLGPPTAANTAAQPVAIETIVTPSLAGTTSFWLQPAGPLPVPGAVPVDPGLHHAGGTVRPPPVATTASSTAPAPGAAYPVPSRVDDELAVEPALLAGELAAGRLPIHTDDGLTEGFRAADEGGGNPPFIEHLDSVEERIEGALLDAYPQRADPLWLDEAQEMPGLRSDPAAPKAASATDLPDLDGAEIAQLLETGGGVSRLAPLPPPSASEGAGAVAWAPPPAADPWPIRPPGMSGEPDPVAFGPWSAPPGLSSQVVDTETILPPVMSTDAPPGWQGAATPGFGRAASGAVELPFSHREAIALQFGTEDALLAAEVALRTRHADAFGWSATQWPEVLADLHWIHTVVRWDSATSAATFDVHWRAMEALADFLQLPHPAP